MAQETNESAALRIATTILQQQRNTALDSQVQYAVQAAEEIARLNSRIAKQTEEIENLKARVAESESTADTSAPPDGR